jgi:hypothetical protein
MRVDLADLEDVAGLALAESVVLFIVAVGPGETILIPLGLGVVVVVLRSVERVLVHLHILVIVVFVVLQGLGALLPLRLFFIPALLIVGLAFDADEFLFLIVVLAQLLL